MAELVANGTPGPLAADCGPNRFAEGRFMDGSVAVGVRIDLAWETRSGASAFDGRQQEAIMAPRDPSKRNLWIVAVLVVLAVAVLAWFLNSRAGTPGGDIADVRVEAPPGPDRNDGERRSDPDVAGAIPDTLAPPVVGMTAGGN